MIIRSEDFRGVCSKILGAVDNNSLSTLTETVELKTEGSNLFISVTNMDYMFNNCQSLTSIPNFNTSNVVYINSAFYNCTNLTSIKISDNLTSIERYAFTGTGYYKHGNACR